MKFRPLYDRIVIGRAEGDLKSTDGIIIPDTAKEKPRESEENRFESIRQAAAERHRKSDTDGTRRRARQTAEDNRLL